jgi:pimeloyl-ACP methyl ester carboxylesterase
MEQRTPAEVPAAATAVDDAGPLDGFPVVVCSGSPGSRLLEARAVETARPHGLRLIGYDRPGYGDAPPQPGRTIADGAGDIRRIAGELGLARIGVWGVSGGGAYALAAAALLPDLVAGACVFAALGPYGAAGLDFLAGMGAELAEEVALHFADEAGAREKWHADVDEMAGGLSTPAGWLERWGDRAGKDEAHDAATARFLAENCAEALRQGDEGWWEDWWACLRPWGFRLDDVKAPVRLWHGADDRSVPVAHGRYLASRLPNVEAAFPAGDDHEEIDLSHREEAMAWLSALGRS